MWQRECASALYALRLPNLFLGVRFLGMALATLIAITLACVAWSLWIRRVTWTCRWEVAATVNIVLQGAAVLLMSPLASETLGRALCTLTGKWNLEDYLGHDC